SAYLHMGGAPAPSSSSWPSSGLVPTVPCPFYVEDTTTAHNTPSEVSRDGYFDNLEGNSRNVTNSMTLPAKISNQNFIVLLEEVQAPISGSKSSYFFAVLDQLDSNTVSDGRVGLFSFYTNFLQDNPVGHCAQMHLLVLLVMSLLVAAVAAELLGGAEILALPHPSSLAAVREKGFRDLL
uniref:Uncharacterized protein n=1 Tax=Amazona collaria TaxID=241587 RepID=A0A8B9F2H5_9PSIT